MTDYTDWLEDTVFCNDRSLEYLGGWSPNNNFLSLYFNGHSNNSDLSCTRTADKFSVSNNIAKLTYPVGMITHPESSILTNRLIIGHDTWGSYYTMTPAVSNPQLYIYSVSDKATNVDANHKVWNQSDIRPVVSLKPETEYVSGTGSMADPYIVDMGLQKPSFNESAINNGTKTVTITYSPKCGTEYTCKYTKNNFSEVTVNT